MSFDDLPRQGSMNPNADAYGAECLARSREASLRVPSITDVRYGDDYWQSLDIYHPAVEGEPLPVLIYFHGGGFTHGYKEWCGFMAPAIIAFPAIFVSASYRLLPQVELADIMEDGRSAVRWVHDSIARYDGDRDRIFLGGHSAGANLVAKIALDVPKRRGTDIADASIRAVFAMSGSYTHYTGYGNALPERGGASDSIPAAAEALGPSKPRFHISWGARERDPFPQAGKAFSKVLAEASVPVESLEFPQDDHFSVHLNTGNPDNPWTRTVRAWMEEIR